MTNKREPRIAFIDIETAPILGYSWTIYDTNLVHVVEPTYLLAFAYAWLDGDKIYTHTIADYPEFKKNKKNDGPLAKELWHVLDEADIVVAHNGDAFDIKKINSRLIVNGLSPPSTYRTVDTLKWARKKFKFDSNKLDNIGGYLKIGRKIPNTGMDLWLRCMDGDPKAIATMRKYNAQDVRLDKEVYLKLRPWADNHPNLNVYTAGDGCPKCKSMNLQKRGYEYTQTRQYQRYRCLDCFGWFKGETIKVD